MTMKMGHDKRNDSDKCYEMHIQNMHMVPAAGPRLALEPSVRTSEKDSISKIQIRGPENNEFRN